MWNSSSIARELTPLGGAAWRVTESPDAMLRLLSTDPFTAPGLLDDLLSDGGRNYPAECRHLHPLLKAPFERRDSAPPASRFRRRRAHHRALYLAEHRDTALAEFSFHQLLFFSASDGAAWPARPRPIIVLRARYATDHGADLTAAPFAADERLWIDPEDYTHTQAFGAAAHAASVQAIRFASARDPRRRANVAVLECACIVSPKPLALQPWTAAIEPQRVALYITAPGHPNAAATFKRSIFEVDGRLPRPYNRKLHPG
ncbi:MAG TPA: RES family NAD+ phosphorylase [Salinisphaeraceae bacterium]|nr:RES family NAD+ phosphorylase [Salinisphaeraceae bacterium]